mmetsp:Transcript_26888/g.52805  ORF Transcript_26888/g.52805 Transcript_26888/m.52805 type:complete len:121 (+) Transcript_26888:1512-1874(+)
MDVCGVQCSPWLFALPDSLHVCMEKNHEDADKRVQQYRVMFQREERFHNQRVDKTRWNLHQSLKESKQKVAPLCGSWYLCFHSGEVRSFTAPLTGSRERRLSRKTDAKMANSFFWSRKAS